MEEKINFVKWLGQKKSLFLKEGLFAIIFFVTFALYHLPLAAIFYPVLLCFVTGMLFLVWDYRKFAVRHERLQQLSAMPFDVMTDFPESVSVLETDYQQIIVQLQEGQRRMKDEMSFQYQDMMDYYTVWAHQIKTPIAAMRLTLQNTDSSLSRKLSVELARVEQYVDMVLCYLRLDTDTRDYVIAVYDLDDILRQALRKFAGQFIGKKIHLDYQSLNAQVMTDEKWLLFVIEQILSNALKYTQPGLCVHLSGITEGYCVSVIRVWGLQRRICREYSRRGIPGITAERIKKPVDWGYIFAPESVITWAMVFRLNRNRIKGP